jgi:hypothetical protein
MKSFRACHSREGGNPEMFAKKAGCPPCAGMTENIYLRALSGEKPHFI